MVAARAWLAGAAGALRPPPRLSLSEWADRHFYLSPESSAEPGRWRTLPYQRGILDAITDPAVERVTLMKSARVGYTKCINAAIGYYMHQDPCPILVVQPTVEDAQGYSKEEIAPMLRDVEVLADLVGDPTAKVSEQTILGKAFPGGVLTMVGANSGRGFRRVSRRIVIFDEVDGYPATAGAEGDQIKLGIRRTDYYWNRKIIAGSTPLVAGASRIEEMFEAGDRRRYHVPCPHCGHVDILVFREGDRGHWMAWPEGDPARAHFVCRRGGCVIEDHDKRGMLEGGEWRGEATFAGHASFHIWAAYSLSPNATWGQIAAEFVEANGQGPEKLRTFVNTALGEVWHERGEAPDWERLFLRRETYPIGTVPAGVRFLTCGVDVQKDRFVYEVVGWSATKESWSVEAGILTGDTSAEASWSRLDELLGRTYDGPGGALSIAMLAIDSGYNTQQVYSWARRYPMARVIACKGVATSRTLVGAPSAVDVTTRGRRSARGYKVWPVGVDVAKAELYGWLRLPRPGEGEDPAPGYLHFPEHGEDYFKQLTAEHLVTVRKRNGWIGHEWHVQPGRENHYLDARVSARAAASRLGLDQMAQRSPASSPAAPRSRPAPGSTPARAAKLPAPTSEKPRPSSPASPNAEPGRGGWLGGGRGGRKGGWLGGRRR
jgi:phage terminase large subunit GpA-like protein